MKVKVLKRFRDKETNEVRKKNDVFTCTKERFNEILSVDKLVEEVKEKNEKKDEE